MNAARIQGAPAVTDNEVSAPAPALLIAIICGGTDDARYPENTTAAGTYLFT
jgi:hypothetical protein